MVDEIWLVPFSKKGKDVTRLMQRVEDVVIKSIMATTPPVAAAVKMFVPHRSNCFGKINRCTFKLLN